jgi:hypothetical protein
VMNTLNLGVSEYFTYRWDSPAKLTVTPHSTLGDFNKDGRADFALSMMDIDGSTNDLKIFVAGEKQFIDGTALLINPQPTYQSSNILSADLNSDGYTDLVIGRSGGDPDTLVNNGIAGDSQLIYISNKNGKYETVKSSYAPYVHNVMLSDVDSDGDVDGFFFATSVGPSVLAINEVSTTGQIRFTTNGLPDKAINVSTVGSWDVLERYPNGPTKTMRGWHQHNTAFNDVDRDGDLDMVAFFSSSEQGLIYLNSGNGNFSQQAPLAYDATIPGIPSTGNYLYGLLNADGSWKGIRVVKQGSNFYETVQFDINGDGWRDVLAVATRENQDFINISGVVTFQNGTHRFNHGTFYSTLINTGTGLRNETGSRILQPDVSLKFNNHYGHFTMLSAVDLDGDGRLDFTSNMNNGFPTGRPNQMGESDTVFMLNDGLGNFKPSNIEGLEFGSFHPLPIEGKLGFVAVTVPLEKDWAIPGHPPRPYAELQFYKTDIPWTQGDDKNNFLYGTVANDFIDGSAGIDTYYANGRKSEFKLDYRGDWYLSDRSQLNGTDSLKNIERVRFDDYHVGLDIGQQAGQAYRVYKAAFNRDPMAGDTKGLGYWIAQIDKGMDLIEVSARFVDSNEFRTLYGTNPTNEQFLTKLYQNVLGRQPEASGYNWWLNELNTNPEKTKAKVLADFAESSENQTGVINLIGNGITYEPWVG